MQVKMNYKLGMTSALACAFIWGVLPLYWKALIPISSGVIIFYRILLVSIVCFLSSLKKYGAKATFEPARDKRCALKLILAGVIITLNWSTYIWAVNAGHIIQTSIGYYMEPLIVSLFGIILFKEEFTKYRKISFALAAVAVGILIVHFGRIPAVSIILAVSFACYAALKKSLGTPPMISLFWETVFLAPFALGVIVWLECTGKGALAVSQPYQYFLLLLAGVATAIPLGLFAVAANNLPLITLGLTEYISPSISLLLGIFMFKEPFDIYQFATFFIIWIGLAVFTVGEIKLVKAEEE